MTQWDSIKSLYDSGKFSDALQALREVKIQSANEFYNAGLVYLKGGQIAKAEAFFFKASILSKGGTLAKDALHNLSVATTQLAATTRPASHSFFAESIVLPAKQMSLTELMAPCGVFILISAILLRIDRRKQAGSEANKKRPILLASLPGIFGILLLFAAIFLQSMDLCTPTSSMTEVRSGPGKTFVLLDTLQPTIILFSTHTEKLDGEAKLWTKVEYGKGATGWVLKEELLAL